MPIRIQRRRIKGWKMPANTVYVGRGTRWGNPFPTHEEERDGHGDIITGRKIEVRSAHEAVKLYAEMMLPYSHHGKRSTMENLLISEAVMKEIQLVLKGKNLACWCEIDQPCHADFLLKIANDAP